MKLTLIKPNIGRMPDGRYIDEGRMEPLQLGVLAGLTPADIEVVLYDDRMEDIPYDEQTDLVAITVETYTARRSYEISAAYRQRGVPVLMGGMHPTLIPEEVAEHADSIVTGDAEHIWAKVLKDAEKGKLQARYTAKPGPPQPGTFTRRDLFKGKGYLPVSLLQFSRGCRFRCNYCAISSFFGATQFRRDIAETIEEIERQDRKLLFFVDDNIVSNPAASKELFKALIPMKVRWVSQGSIDMTKDSELMDLMLKSGCLGNVIGFETVTKEGLRAMKKGPNLPSFDQYQRPLDVLNHYGLQTWAAFVLGHDAETPDTLKATHDFAMANKFCFAAFNIMMPYPGTPLYTQLEREQRLLFDGKWWLHPDYRFNHASFVPKHMSPETLTELSFGARKSWNSLYSIARRLFNLKTNMRTLERMGVFLRFNPLFRKETFKKQDMHFGVK